MRWLLSSLELVYRFQIELYNNVSKGKADNQSLLTKSSYPSHLSTCISIGFLEPSHREPCSMFCHFFCPLSFLVKIGVDIVSTEENISRPCSKNHTCDSWKLLQCYFIFHRETWSTWLFPTICCSQMSNAISVTRTLPSLKPLDNESILFSVLEKLSSFGTLLSSCLKRIC